MALFGAFSFDPTMPHHPYGAVTHLSTTSTSPTYTPVPARRKAYAISDLAHQFSQHSLTKRPLPDALSLAPPPQDMPSRSPSPPTHAAYRRMSASALRAQRQANIRLLADASHLQELHALVERMVDSQDQCRVCAGDGGGSSAPCSPVSSTASSSSFRAASSSPRAEDEGFGEMELVDEPLQAEGEFPSRALRYRRSGDLVVPAMVPCVRKDIKVRKRRQQKTGGAR